MKISRKEWFLFCLAAIFGIFLWFKFEYPKLIFMDFSVNKSAALAKADDFMRSWGVNQGEYQNSIVLNNDIWADRYLQKTIGAKQEEFLKKHNYQLFSWHIRFFKELQKEEYSIDISPQTGEIIAFNHLIEDIEPRKTLEKETARNIAEDFLKKTYGVVLEDYKLHEEKVKQYEKRADYIFSWERKDVYIPWGKQEGGAKLLMGLTISGEEVRGFYKIRLDIPEKFRRYVESQLIFGEYLSSLALLLFTVLLVAAITIIIQRKNAFAIRITKRWFFYLAGILFAINLANIFNNLESLLMAYPTTTSLASFFGLSLLKTVMGLLFFSIAFTLPGFAAEALSPEVFPQNRYNSFTHYIKTTFYSRTVSKSVMLGYALFFIILGLQSVIFFIGNTYLGVWKESIRVTLLSSSFLPFFGAFVIGARASLYEEITFRLFSISCFKKYLKNTAVAVLLGALIWGFGHSEYAIFPTWFRGIEVSLIGIFFGFIFIRYGIIPVLVAHYVFDVFWGTAAYVLGRSSAYLFTSSIIVLSLPLLFAIVAYIKNRQETEKQIDLTPTATQKYNLEIIIAFIKAEIATGGDRQEIRRKLISHDWDAYIVDLAFDKILGKSNG